MNISTRLDEAMQAAGIVSQSALARASGVPQPTINRILKGTGKKGPEAHTLKLLATACNVTFEWLHEGREPRSRVSEVVNGTFPAAGGLKIREDGDSPDSVLVPFFEQRIHGGTPGFAGDDEFHEAAAFSLPRKWVNDKGLDPALLFAMKAAGMSMYNTIGPGDVVVLDRAQREPLDGVIFGVNHHGKALLKRFTYEARNWYMDSDNKQPDFPRLRVDEDTRIVGRLVKLEKDFV